MNEERFNADDLSKCSFQYSVRHNDVNLFKVGESVFLKSNPEHKMLVAKLNCDDVSVKWFDNSGNVQICNFPPECILQYKYSALKTFKDKFDVCLN